MKPLDFNQRPLFIRTNYGDDSIALVEWAAQNLERNGHAGHSNVTVVYVDTGFAADGWEARIRQGEERAKQLGFNPCILKSKITYQDAVMGRQSFPSSKFQWCSGLLKGLPFLEYLDDVDIKSHGIILIAKRKVVANAHLNLPEWIERCEFHNDRTVWHPILEMTDKERDNLLQGANFPPLYHRSLECEPCVNSTFDDMARMSGCDRDRLQALETEVGATFKLEPSPEVGEKYLDLFYRGCGNPFGCGS